MDALGAASVGISFRPLLVRPLLLIRWEGCKGLPKRGRKLLKVSGGNSHRKHRLRRFPTYAAHGIHGDTLYSRPIEGAVVYERTLFHSPALLRRATYQHKDTTTKTQYRKGPIP